MIEQIHPKVSVGAQCRLLSISRSSFFCAAQGETAMYLDLILLIDKQLLKPPVLRQAADERDPQNEGRAVNQKRIRRLMWLRRAVRNWSMSAAA